MIKFWYHYKRVVIKVIIPFLLILLTAFCYVNHHGRLNDQPWSHLLGGETSRAISNSRAFTFAAQNLTSDQVQVFFVGNSLFNRRWVQAPASVDAADGLGPLFNRPSCSGCHLRDGRGQPPKNVGDPMDSMLIRLSVPGKNQHGGSIPDPHYGDQLNEQAILGVRPEGKTQIKGKLVTGQYPDGTAYSLFQPSYEFVDLGHGPLASDLQISPRVAPQVIGLGLLEAIPEHDILALADPEDHDGDGISGRPNWVWNVEQQQKQLGRFGWKANQPTLRQQTAGALLGDMGITSSVFPHENCTLSQADCQGAPHGGTPEISDDDLNDLVQYIQTIAVPEQRHYDDPLVKRGFQLFLSARCQSCHVTTHRTADHAVAALSHQTIHPMTDLLLHDMGPGLADHRPDFEATGSEWRTPPLWGIGLFSMVNQHTRYLHDGRARNLEEAILWHGGEAESSKQYFMNLPKHDRDALIAFLNSL